MTCDLFVGITRSRATVKPGVITQQPRSIDNRFELAGNEHVIQTYTKQPGGCGCGPTYTVHLTNSRIIQRRQEYACCGDGAREDTMLFLSDISAMSDFVRNRNACPSVSYSGLLCCLCLCSGDAGAKQIAIRGAFGEEVFTFALNDVPDALRSIPAAAMPHKGAR